MPAEALSLEVNRYHCAIDQNRRNASHEQLCEPVSRDMLLEERTCSACGGRTRDSFFGQ